MANKFYAKYKESRQNGSYTYNLTSATIKAVLVDTGTYTFSQAHQFYTDLSGIVGSAVTLTTPTLTISGDNVLFSADPISFTGLVAAPTIEAVVFYQDTGVAATSGLICYIDTASGLPTASGQVAVTVTQDATNKFIKF